MTWAFSGVFSLGRSRIISAKPSIMVSGVRRSWGDVGHEVAPQLLRLAQLGRGVVQRVGELRGLQVPRAGEVRVKVPVTELFRLAADGDDGLGDAVGEVEGQQPWPAPPASTVTRDSCRAQGLHRRGDGASGSR